MSLSSVEKKTRHTQQLLYKNTCRCGRFHDLLHLNHVADHALKVAELWLRLPAQFMIGSCLSHAQGLSCAQPLRVSTGTQPVRSGTFCCMHSRTVMISSIAGGVHLSVRPAPHGEVVPARICTLRKGQGGLRLGPGS